MLRNTLQSWMGKEKGRREWASLTSYSEGGTLPILENKVIKLYYWGMFHVLKKITMSVLRRFSCIWLFVTLWKVAHQAPLSMEFSRQEHWSGLPCPPPGDLPNPGIKPRSPTLQADSFLAEPPGKPKNTGVGSLSLLQGNFPTQESNWGLLHCRQILY